MSVDKNLMQRVLLGLTTGDAAMGDAAKVQFDQGQTQDKMRQQMVMEARAEALKQALEDRKDQRQQMHDDAADARANARIDAAQPRPPKSQVVMTDQGPRVIMMDENDPRGAKVFDPIGPKPLANADRQTIADLDRQIATSKQLYESGKAHPEYFTPVTDMAPEALSHVPLVGSALATAARGQRDPGRQSFDAGWQTLMNAQGHAQFGSAFTAAEMERLNKAFPRGPGTTYAQFMAMGPQHIAALEAMRAAKAGANTETTHDGSPATGPSAPAPKPSGVVYERQNGKLVRVQ